MATPIAPNFNRLTSADLLKFKRYLIENVGRSMLRVPRHLFIGRDSGAEAYADHSYPIGFRQTMGKFTKRRIA